MRLILSFLLISSLTACGGTSKSKKSGDSPAAETTAGLENMKVANVKADISCNAASNAYLFYVTSEKVFYKCDGSALTAVDVTGPAGPAGTNGTNGVAGAAGAAGANGTNETNGVGLKKNVYDPTGTLIGEFLGSGHDADYYLLDYLIKLIDGKIVRTYRVTYGDETSWEVSESIGGKCQYASGDCSGACLVTIVSADKPIPEVNDSLSLRGKDVGGAGIYKSTNYIAARVNGVNLTINSVWASNSDSCTTPTAYSIKSYYTYAPYTLPINITGPFEFRDE